MSGGNDGHGDGRVTRYLTAATVIAGFVLMYLGWNGAASIGAGPAQFPYLLSASVPGLALVLCGLVLAIIQEMRRLSARLIERLDQVAASGAEGPAAAGELTAVPDDGSHVLATATAYHLPGCAVIDGRADTTAMGPEVAIHRGLVPCRICNPARPSAA